MEIHYKAILVRLYFARDNRNNNQVQMFTDHITLKLDSHVLLISYDKQMVLKRN